MSRSSVSDQDTSEYSNSPASYSGKSPSPYGSPSQQVPQLVTDLTELTCAEKLIHDFIDGGKPNLRIIEQPQNHFRFRYVSEMVGTHGCLLGKSYSPTNKAKTHPTVELLNYNKKALIRCSLAQNNIDADHPHKLLEDDKDRDVSSIVPENGSYIVGFAGMGIIHTAKKDVPHLLFKKFSEQMKGHFTEQHHKELRAQCDNLAKNINLNIVRLKFSAHDLTTGEEICKPVFSEPIHNLKSAATNDLRIVRISQHTGKPSGGEDVFIFVEKVNKKNIQIRFYELDASGEEVWSSNGSFMLTDVHHQYGIVFRTPPYINQKTPVDVKVYIELLRPTDGRTSEPKEFTYKADQVCRQQTMAKKKLENNKRRRSQCSSLDSCSSGSLNTLLPSSPNSHSNKDFKREHDIPVDMPQSPVLPGLSSPVRQYCGLGSALAGAICQPQAAPLWYQAAGAGDPATAAAASTATSTATSIPNLVLHSSEFEDIIRAQVDLNGEDAQFSHEDLARYMSLFPSMDDMQTEETNSMGFIRSSLVPDSEITILPNNTINIGYSVYSSRLVADSGRATKEKPSSSKRSSGVEAQGPAEMQDQNIIKPQGPMEALRPNEVQGPAQTQGQETEDTSLEYSASFQPEDGLEVKQLVTELSNIIRDKRGYKSQEARTKLERLFDIRLSNGDTFLHMTLFSSLPSFKQIVKVIHYVKMSHLLNYTNHKLQTILHLAVVHRSPEIVTFLLSKGCDPKIKDSNDNDAIHYAVNYNESCLEPLLEAKDKYNIPCDNWNNKKQTALHVACSVGGAGSVRALLRRGWRPDARDLDARTPLHLAALDDRPHAVRELLAHVPTSEIDVTDGYGNTALQIVCGINPHSLEMAKLLLEHKADPSKQEENTESAWKLSRSHPALRALLQRYLPAALHLALDDDVKSEPEDEYESAEDEVDPPPLTGLPTYIRAVSLAVEGAGRWRALSARLAMSPMDEWFAAQPSPAAALLQHVKECGDKITSESLAQILEELKLLEAAKIVREAIE